MAATASVSQDRKAVKTLCGGGFNHTAGSQGNAETSVAQFNCTPC